MDTYEKKYKEANDKVAARFGTNVAKEIFTDLYESEDEKISKEIIKYLERTVPHSHRDEVLKSKEWIAWLEKQGKSDKIVEKAKIEKQRVLVTESDGSANIDWDTRSLEDARKLLEYGLQYINTELEKQGEQKPTDKVGPKFKVGDWITDDEDEAIFHITSYDINYGYQLETVNGTSFHYSDETIEKNIVFGQSKMPRMVMCLPLNYVIPLFFLRVLRIIILIFIVIMISLKLIYQEIDLLLITDSIMVV